MVRSLIAIFSIAIILGACSVHKIDVQQGNVITQEMLEKLKIGMEKQQVSRLLGTPLIKDPFRKGRWDYIYKFVAGDTGETQSSHITLYFDGDNLTKIDVLKTPPAEADVKKTTIRKR
jgi:outer membrane protein assembly factor BamE